MQEMIMKSLEELHDYTFSTRMVNFIKNSIGFCKRLWDYAPIIWQDDDMNFDYILPFMEHKMKRVEKLLKNDKIYLNSDKYARQIRIVLNHLDRWQNAENYVEGYYDEDNNDVYIQDNKIIISPKRKRIARQCNRISEENRKQFWNYLTKWSGRWSV